MQHDRGRGGRDLANLLEQVSEPLAPRKLGKSVVIPTRHLLAQVRVFGLEALLEHADLGEEVCIFYNGPLRRLDRVAIALLQSGQQKRAFLGGAGAAHNSPAALALELAGSRTGVAPGREVLEGEGLGVPAMSVQRRQQGRPMLDDPNPGVRAAMNAALVTFGQTEGAFEVEVVDGKTGVVAAREEAGGKGVHGAAHVDVHRVGACRQQGSLSDEGRTTLLGRSAVWLQVRPDGAQGLGELRDRTQLAGDELSAAVNAIVQLA
jgi:hypothetical protein